MSTNWVEVDFQGFDFAQAQLSSLEDRARAATIRKALDAGAKPIIERVKENAPSPVIASGVQVINRERKSDGEVRMEVGLPGGRRPWFHGLFIELGTGLRATKKGARRGRMPAKPWFRPAVDGALPDATRAFFAALKAELEKVRG